MTGNFEVPIVRFVSGCLRWPHSCVYKEIGRAEVDPEQFPWVSQFRWILIPKPGKQGYARRHIWDGEKSIAVYMHSEIWGRCNGPIPDGFTVDHKNLNTWDNRIGNLRLATIAQQGFNKPAQARNKSGYKGVSFQKQAQKYTASIRCKPNLFFLGYFATAKEAAIAYNEAASRLHGEFACLNAVDNNA